MNSRIEYVSEKEVRIQQTPNEGSANRIRCTNDRIVFCYDEECASYWDAAGLLALNLVINCYTATRSFAALQDTSAAAFIGKRVRRPNSLEATVSHFWHSGDVLLTEGCMHTTCSPCELLPLTPAPPAEQWRPFTRKEACAYYGEHGEFKIRDRRNPSRVRTVFAVTYDSFYVGGTDEFSFSIVFNEFTFADSAKPVGILEQ